MSDSFFAKIVLCQKFNQNFDSVAGHQFIQSFTRFSHKIVNAFPVVVVIIGMNCDVSKERRKLFHQQNSGLLMEVATNKM